MTRTTLTKLFATVMVVLFVLVVAAGGLAAAVLYPWWACLAYAVGSAWAGYMAGEAMCEIWTSGDVRDLI